MDERPILIVLDRDGVLNRTIPNPAEPRPDSPLRVDEVSVFPWVPGVLRAFTDAGYGLVIASNQPAAAKGKVSREELDRVHGRVLAEVQREGGVILSSHICFHRAEDGCACRKPRTGLLREVFERHPGYAVDEAWMVGDRAVDVLAGAAFGLKTALLPGHGPGEGAQGGAGDRAGDRVSDGAHDRAAQELDTLAGHAVQPSFCGPDLRDFAELLLTRPLGNLRKP